MKSPPLRDAFPVPPFARGLGIPGVFILAQVFPAPSNLRPSRPFFAAVRVFFPRTLKKEGSVTCSTQGPSSTRLKTPALNLRFSERDQTHIHTPKKGLVIYPSRDHRRRNRGICPLLSVRKIVASYMCMCICPGRGDCSRDSTQKH